jgi:hypothetical protein
MAYIDDRSLLSMNNTLSWTFLTKKQWSGSFGIVYNSENLRDSLEFNEDGVCAPPGRYDFISFDGLLSTPANRSFYVILTTKTGQFFDGSRVSVNMQPTWNVSKHFELGTIYNYDWVDFSERGQKMINHILGVKTLFMLDTKLSVSAYIQYNTAVKDVLTNLRLRYNPKEGNDFYLVFNEGRYTNLERENPNLPVYSTRSLMVKYTYTFNL